MIIPPTTPEVRAFCSEHGLLMRLYDMVQRSARVTHPDGNRRFHEYVFRMDGARVVGVVNTQTGARSGVVAIVAPAPSQRPQDLPMTRPPWPPLPVLKAGEFVVYDECDDCYGRGCTKCENRGEIRRIRRERR